MTYIRAGIVKSARDVLARAATIAIRCQCGDYPRSRKMPDTKSSASLDCAIRRQFVDRDAPQVEDRRVSLSSENLALSTRLTSVYIRSPWKIKFLTTL